MEGQPGYVLNEDFRPLTFKVIIPGLLSFYYMFSGCFVFSLHFFLFCLYHHGLMIFFSHMLGFHSFGIFFFYLLQVFFFFHLFVLVGG